MPQVIPWAVQAIGTALTGTALAAGTVSVISAAVYALGSLALSNYQTVSYTHLTLPTKA